MRSGGPRVLPSQARNDDARPAQVDTAESVTRAFAATELPTARIPVQEPPTMRLALPNRTAGPVGPAEAQDGAVRAACAVRPGLASFLVTLVVALGLSYAAWRMHDRAVGVVGWATTMLWTIPLSSSLIGLTGCLRTRRVLRAHADAPPVAPVDNMLLVVVPTIGRLDTYPALERVVASYCEHLPAVFRRLRIDVVIEENCPAREAIAALAGPRVRIVTVPARYATPAGTRFKARAIQFANERRIAEGEARPDVWVLHMDDDTGVADDTAVELARFVAAQNDRGDEALHLAQGVLTFPREHAARRLIWLADATRPAQDVSLYSVTTGRGTPLAGLHGELQIVRASVEAEIGWDFGPRAVVEDSQFALNFVARHPGRSGWFPGRSIGANPVTVVDLLRQRERWAWGLLELAADKRIPLRNRLLLIHNMIIWSCGPLQHIGVVIVAGGLLGDLDTFPATAALLPLWAINVGFQVWTYWEGLKINARASADPRRRWTECAMLLPLIPIFSLWETAGFLRGFLRFIRHHDAAFAVIAKPL